MALAATAQRAEPVRQALEQIGSVLFGKPLPARLALACVLARGHLLIEDLPGLGKTTLASALARVTGLDYRRVQFTSDMLPADLTGFGMYHQERGTFEFQPGPIFCQLLLADEINRCSPKTQSALLEAMEERQVSVDGVSRLLPEPFFVIATQNPFSLAGTFPLPESQLDRFLMRISMGYPEPNEERRILAGTDPRAGLVGLTPSLDTATLMQMQDAVAAMRVTDALLDYVQRLIAATRNDGQFVHGISPRGGMALIQCARAWAYIDGRDFVTPDDVQAVVAPVFGHRLMVRQSGAQASLDLIQDWAMAIDVLSG